MLTSASITSQRDLATNLGIRRKDKTSYVQCPDPGEPYTCGGTVVFELRREETEEES